MDREFLKRLVQNLIEVIQENADRYEADEEE